MFDRGTRVHMIGIGGTGMSGLAEVLLAMGCRVSGSDREGSVATERLASCGITIQVGHEPRLVDEAEVVVYSSAIKPDNPERARAGERGIRQIRRAEVIGELMRGCTSVGVAGTHGKTTTTSLLGSMLAGAGRRPTILAGGAMRDTGSGAVLGSGELLVVEADEFDRSFLAMSPTIAVITNIDREHLDCYEDLEDIKSAFVSYANSVPADGCVIACTDCPVVEGILPRIERRVVAYGSKANAPYQVRSPISGPEGSTFEAMKDGMLLGRVGLRVPGRHNALNAMACVAAALELGVEFEMAAKTAAAFGGVRRRFETVGIRRGVTVVDDYAHHPREITATLTAAREMGHRRVVAVFQPHLYTRTRDLLEEFVDSLAATDVLVVNEVYGAREGHIDGVSAEAIVDGVRNRGHNAAHYVANKEQIPALLAPLLTEGDCVVTMGAGDIWKSCTALLEELDRG